MEQKVSIFDTTLRDGEQSPGASLTAAEKLEIARQLTRLGVDVIEAGFPSSSPGDFEAVRQIARTMEGPVVTALARAVKADIEEVWASIKEARRPRIHIVLGSSDIHVQHKFNRSRDEVLETGVEAVRFAKSLCTEVQYSTEDASRSDRRYLFRVIEAVIDAGATVVNIPDTVGYAVPGQWRRLIADIRRNVPNIDRAVLSVHCHNDLGMAVANTLAAVEAGARQVECTINGIGERAGNAALEEVVMALRVRRKHYRVSTGIDAGDLSRTSRLVGKMTGLTVARNKAIVGANAFAHSSGIHQDGVLKHRGNYEIMRPEDVGAGDTQIILTARSGRHALRHRLEKLGFAITPEELEELHGRFLTLADAKKEVFDDDLFALATDRREPDQQRFQLAGFRIESGTSVPASATVSLGTGQGVVETTSPGDGPVDAAFRAIDEMTGVPVTLKEYHVDAVTAEKAALGEARVIVERNGSVVSASGVSTDVVEASIKAYVNAINRLVAGESGRS